MAQTATIKIQLRRGTLPQWQAANPVLLQGEVGLVHDGTYPVAFVIGNGTQSFNDLWASNAHKYSPDSFWAQTITTLSNTLSAQITAEANTRGAADIAITNNLNAEIAARIAGDSTLATGLTNETNARVAADTAINAAITNLDTVLTASIAGLETNIQTWYGTASNAGDILAYDPAAGTFLVLTVGAAGEVLVADPLEPLGLKWIPAPSGGGGDMLKSEYDPNNDGVVNAAETAWVADSVDWADVANKPAVIGDMEKSTYDVDDDGVVDAAEREQVQVKNGTGATLTAGTIVYIKTTSTSAQYPEVLKADATTEPTSSKTIGAVFENIPNGDIGYIVTSGRVHNLDTSAYTVGTKLWLSTTPGQVTSTPPAYPNHTVFIGFITRSQVNNGGILYAIQNGFELEELHNVVINAPDPVHVLRYDGAKWVNDTVDNALGYTPADDAAVATALAGKENTIAAGTTGQYWRGDKAWATLDKAAVGLSNVDNTSDANKPISTATQTALNAKENTIAAGNTTEYWRGDKTWQTLNKAAVGLSNVDNTSDANKPVSTATQTALNAKQNTLILTTTGSSGPATLVGSTLNVPEYAGGGGGVSAGEAIAYAIALG